jgi:DNA-binding ferritin-like protein
MDSAPCRASIRVLFLGVQMTRTLRAVHEICDHHNDVATASLIEVWIDETERRTWFLAEIRSEA